MLDDLLAQWAALAAAQGLDPQLGTDTRTARDGRTIYVVWCANGYHESYESHERALYALVEAHTIYAEDTPAVYEQLLPLVDGDVAAARALAQDIACPCGCACATDAEHDAKTVAAVAARVAEWQAAQAAIVPEPAPVVVEPPAPTQEELAAQAAQAAEDALRMAWWEEQRAKDEAAYQAWKAARVVP